MFTEGHVVAQQNCSRPIFAAGKGRESGEACGAIGGIESIESIEGIEGDRICGTAEERRLPDLANCF